jgi:O-antigen/teichoic acid export membrane protein/glycosyltransferase involved in cell wall biosynthesis
VSELFGPSDRLVFRLATNTVIQAVGIALGSLISFVTFIAVTRGLGPEAYGDYTASIVFVFIPVVLVDIGLSTTVVRQISARPETTEPVMRTTIPLRIAITFLVVTVILAAALVAPVTDRTRVGIAIGSLGAIAILLMGSISPVFQAQLKQQWYVLANVVGRVATLVLTLGALELDYGFKGVVWANVAGIWATALVAIFAAARFVSLRPVVDVSAWRGIVRGAVALALALGLAQVYLRIDALLLAFLKPEYEVGIYGAAWRFVEVAGFIAGAVCVTVLPALSRFVESDDARLRRMTRRSLDVMLAAAIPITVLYIAYARDIVVVSAGDEFPEAGIALRILAPYIPMMFVGALFWNVLIAHWTDRVLLRLALVAVGSNVALNLVLIPPFGYRGAAAAALSSEAIALLLGALAVARAQGLPSFGYLGVLAPAAGAMVILVLVLPGPPLIVGGAAVLVYGAIVTVAPGTGRDIVVRVFRFLRSGREDRARAGGAPVRPSPAEPREAGPVPRASVVVACRNAAATIEEALAGLERQAWSQPWEIVVADNGSTDETADIVERFRARIPTLRLVDASDRVGAGHARNVGVDQSRGRLLLFADADDVVAPGWIAALLEALEQVDLAISRMDFDGLNPLWARATRSGHQTMGPMNWWFGGSYFPFAYGGTYAVRREWHERIGGFDVEMTASEDIDYCWRLQEAGASVRFIPEAVVHYRLRSTLSDLYSQALRYGESWPAVYKKHRPRGLPPAGRKPHRIAAEWARALRHLPLAYRKERRARLVWDVGTRVGMVRGSLKHRVLLL